MSDAANCRVLLESVRILVNVRQPTPEIIAKAVTSLAQVISDMSGQKVMLMIEFEEKEGIDHE